MRGRIDTISIGGARAEADGGFTLIEMLAVLFILGILVALIVGVSRYVMDQATRKETAATQAIVMEAIRTYYDDKDEYPADSADNPATHNVNEDGVSLLTALEANAAAKDKLRDLPASALSAGGDAILDAYGKPMRYLKDRGRGGKPVLISAGADGKYGTDDDIRSDGQ